MCRLLALAVSLASLAALAQAPEDGWERFPGGPDAGIPAVPVTLQRPLGPPSSATAEAPPRKRVPEVPNTISMAGAPTLGQWTRGWMLSVGFPLLSVRFSVGLSSGFDVGVAFDSFYLVMNEPRLVVRGALVRTPLWTLSLTGEAGYAFFTVRAPRETRGARWLTGRRNINISPAVVMSYQGLHPRSPRLFAELRYLLALDTEPYSTTPLGGDPPPVVPGHNVAVKGGAELPLSSTTSFLFTLGLEIHGRAEDSTLMPSVSVGIVTSL